MTTESTTTLMECDRCNQHFAIDTMKRHLNHGAHYCAWCQELVVVQAERENTDHPFNKEA